MDQICALIDTQGMSGLQQYAARQQIDINTEAIKDNFRTANKIAVADHKHQLDIQKEAMKAELLEHYRARRQLATRSVIENADGYLIQELILPDGKHHYSEPICTERFFKAKYYYATDSSQEENVLRIFWQDEKTGIFLSGKSMTAKAMNKAFLMKGVVFRISRRAKEEILEQIFSYLINKAEYIEIPRCVGWTKNSAGIWVFEKEEAKTLEGINHEGK